MDVDDTGLSSTAVMSTTPSRPTVATSTILPSLSTVTIEQPADRKVDVLNGNTAIFKRLQANLCPIQGEADGSP